MQRSLIPTSLGGTFTVRDATIAGVAPSRLRSSDLEAPVRGVRVLPKSDPADSAANELDILRERVRVRAGQYALVMPNNQFYSHVTAAILWGLAIPASLLLGCFEDAARKTVTLDIAVLTPVRTPRGSRWRGHQALSSHAHVREVDGLRVTSPATTWAMLAAMVRDVRDLVAIADSAVRADVFQTDPPPLATLNELTVAVLAGRRQGIGRLREALPLVRTRSVSRPETWCRLELVDAGMPEPELNWWVCDDSGEFIACVDLAYPGVKIAIEYEGEHHLTDPEQWAKDIERHARLADAGWIVIRVTKHQLFSEPHKFVARVHRAFASRR
ncbi:endonuclease domain-containing protein (plasmid) [Coraliomargarita sp. W4R53]